uniref:Uncharacterized protein n=1 Tax=viral metagenome TaxID=1070528 RepID=A0A6C0CWL4_9ZZZZ
MAIIYSKGFQQSITNDGLNSKPLINEIQWDTNYKNNQGTMNVNINKNGKKNKYQVKLNKNDLENILKMPVVNQSLDQRLAHDFPIFESESSFPKQNILNKSKSKRNYDELEDLFTLRKKLMTPYHLTHHGTTNKTRKANKAKQNPKKKVNNKKSQKNNKNKAKGVTKFFNQFF